MLKRVVFLAVSLGFAARAEAQIYTSSQYSAAYVPVSGGTELTFVSNDDSATPVALGFTFNFYGVDYSFVNVATNGYLYLAEPCPTGVCSSFSAQCISGACQDTSASTGAFTVFPDPNDLNGVVAPFWDDLLITSGAKVVTQLQGTAPNRIFVVEWQNVRHFGGPTAESANFQARLLEGGGVQLAWGPMTLATPPGTWSGNLVVENPTGTEAFWPNIACANSATTLCDAPDLQGMANQVLEVRLVDGPELLGTVNPPPGGDPGALIRVGVTARNIGTRTTTSGFAADVYFSTDSIITPGTDTLLGRVNFPIVPAGGVRTATLTTHVPAMLMPGIYHLGALIDPLRVVPEVSRTNNIAVSGVFLVGPEVSATVSGPARTGPGESFDATLEVVSSGSPVAAVGYDLYLSSDTTLDSADTLVATGTAAMSGARASVPVTITLPLNFPPGNYHLAVRVDPRNRISEIDETNNVFVASSALTVVGPDVVAVDVSGATSAFRGLSYDVAATIRNAGGARASNFYYSFHLSPNQLITTTDPKLGEIGPITLTGGESITVHHTFTISSTLAAGTYYLGIITDSTSALLEEVANLPNNIKRQTAPVIVRDPAPDFTASGIVGPISGAAGEALVVARTLSNVGNANGMANYTIYLSSDAIIDPASDVPIGMGSLQLGALRDDEGVDTAHVPSETAPGNYYLGYVMDSDHAVMELDETNNAIASAATLSIEAGALKIVSQSPLPQATVGLPYQYDVAARGGSGRYTWSLVGTLPAGLSFDPATARISGNPSREAQSTFVIHVSDGSLTAQAMFQLIVAEPSIDLQIISRAIPPAFVNRRYEFPLTAIGGVPPYVWTADGALPGGLQLSAAGVISGTAPAVGLQTLTFHARDAAGHAAERPITVRVVASDDALRFSNDVLRDGVVDKAYADNFRVMNGVSPYTFTLSDGAPPPGLAIVDDKLTGTPTVAGTYTFGVRVTDNRGDSDTNRFVVTIEPDEGVKFVTTGLPAGVRGTPYAEGGGAVVRVKAVATGVMGAITYRLVAGDLPLGISLASDGVLSGTPTATGLFTFTVEAKDAAAELDYRALAIVVDEPPPTPTPAPTPSGCGCNAIGSPGEAGLYAMAVLGLGLLRRRRRLSLVFGALLVLATALPVQAQTMVPYFLSQETQAFTSRTGTQLPFFFPDDDNEAVVSLPFPFRFFDQTYNQVHIGTNGLVSFTDNASSLGNGPFPDGSTPNAVIAAYWDDLVANDALTTTEGMAPTRIFIIQWDCERLGSGGRVQAQLWLYEGAAGRFEIHYGTSATATFTASVGFEDAQGASGFSWLTCSPNCSGSDLAALDGTVLRALQDGGEDVLATAISTPARVYPGTPVTITSSLQSLHQTPLGPLTYDIYLVAAGSAGPGTSVFHSAPVTLTAYQTLRSMDAVTIPVDTVPGRYVLRLRADSGNQLTEPDESNNSISSNSFVIGERRPDFTAVTVVAAPATVSPSGSLTVNVPLQNAGNLDGTANWELVLSQNRIISVDDRVVYTASTALPLLSTRTATVVVTVPSDLAPGPYWVGVILDPENLVRELNEVNNAAATRAPIAVGVDTIAIATDALPGGYVGVDYSTFLTAVGGDGSYTWAADGALPAGLTLLPSSGELRGKPTAAFSSMISLRVTSAGHTATKMLPLSISVPGGPLTIVTRNLLPGQVGLPYPPLEPGQDISTAQRIVAVNANGTATFSLTTAAPPGLSFESDGLLHGVPRQRGVFDVAVSATDGTNTATRTIPFTVVEPGRLSLVAAVLPDGVLEEDYRYQLQVLGQSDTASVTFQLGPDEILPDGLALTSAGQLVGVPTRVGRWRFAVTAVEAPANATSARDSANFSLEVTSNVGFGITPSSLPVAIVGTPYDSALDARGGNPPFTWRLIIQGNLPRGMRYEVEDAAGGRARMRFLGTPEAVPTGDVDTGGLVSFMVTVEDAVGRKASQPLAIRVEQPPPSPTPEPKSGGCSCAASESEPGSTLLGVALLALLGWSLRSKPVRSRRR
ncbi:MAG: putative Ig domain-containing protein [Myxococcota bacterium]